MSFHVDLEVYASSRSCRRSRTLQPESISKPLDCHREDTPKGILMPPFLGSLAGLLAGGRLCHLFVANTKGPEYMKVGSIVLLCQPCSKLFA